MPIYNIYNYDGESDCFVYRVECDEAKIKELVDKFNKIKDTHCSIWSYRDEKELMTIEHIEEEIIKTKIAIEKEYDEIMSKYTTCPICDKRYTNNWFRVHILGCQKLF